MRRCIFLCILWITRREIDAEDRASIVYHIHLESINSQLMGTKVQHTSYLPGFYAMRDLNEEAGGCWSQYYEDNTSGVNLYNGYQLRPTNGYSEYDKEMLKRTMLEHEAIFRKQVYELHRLYRIQKDLMDELKTGPCRRPQADTSQSNSFSSQIPSEGASRMFQMAHLPEATASNNRAPLTATDDKKLALNFLNESSVQSGPVSTGKEIAVKDGEIFDCNHKGLPRRMFDLQLPADVYIDCEEEERSAKEAVAESSSVTTVSQERIQGSDPENNMKLTLIMGEAPNCREESWKSCIRTQSGPATRSLSDLNEPVRETFLGKATGSMSAILVPRTPPVENQGLPLPLRSSTSISGLPTAFLKGRHRDEGTSSNHLRVDDDETRREWPFFNNEAGDSTSRMKLFSPGSSKEKFSMPSEQIQPNQKHHEILSLDQNKMETWFKPKLEISGRCLPNSILDAYSDYTNAASPVLSSWTKPANGYSHVPLAVLSLQCFNGTATPNHSNPSDKWHYSGDLRSQFRVGNDPTSYQNGFNHGFRFDHNSASPAHTQPITFGKPNLSGRSGSNHEGCGHPESQKDVHLNQTLLTGFRNGFPTQKINESEGKCEDLSGTLSWLRRKPTSNASSLMELDLSQGYPQLKPACSVINPRYDNRQETEKSINLFNLQDLQSSSQVKETKVMRNVASGHSSKKIFGFPIPERTQQSAAFSPHQNQFLTVATKYNKEDELKLPNLETQVPPGELVATSSVTSSRNHVNLNSDLNSTDISNEGEMLEVPLKVSAPTVTFKIDLEATIVLEEEEKPGEASVREAAESIILISSGKCSHLDDIPPHPLTSVAYNPLHWFAEVVSSNAEGVKEPSDDWLDPFELLTLELEETKPEEYWCRTWEGQKDDDDDDGKSTIASLLFTKHRRGQARKRRQKRDFQKDILPGLSSLSRHEMTEDLQTIGALMKASGQSWLAGGTMRRNASRNGTTSRGRVGRRPRSLAVSVEEIQVSPHPPPPQPASNTEVEVDGRNMIGWGRTTRRCRRQRFPPVTNVAAPLT